MMVREVRLHRFNKVIVKLSVSVSPRPGRSRAFSFLKYLLTGLRRRAYQKYHCINCADTVKGKLYGMVDVSYLLWRGCRVGSCHQGRGHCGNHPLQADYVADSAKEQGMNKRMRTVAKIVLPSVVLAIAGAINVHIGGISSNTLALVFGWASIAAAGLLLFFPLLLEVDVYGVGAVRREAKRLSSSR